jgi:hypothetical protein
LNEEFESIKNQFNDEFTKYFKVASTRYDKRSGDFPEDFGDYLYYTYNKKLLENDYLALYRKKKNSQEEEELVLDLA